MCCVCIYCTICKTCASFAQVCIFTRFIFEPAAERIAKKNAIIIMRCSCESSLECQFIVCPLTLSSKHNSPFCAEKYVLALAHVRTQELFRRARFHLFSVGRVPHDARYQSHSHRLDSRPSLLSPTSPALAVMTSSVPASPSV